MDKLKKVCKVLLFPHMAILWLLFPVATAFLVYSMLTFASNSAAAILSYVLAAYTLTVWCFRIPKIIKWATSIKNENKLALRLSGDVRFRVSLSLAASFLWNTAYAAFQLGLGIFHSSFWYYSMAGYYISLAVMRLFLVGYTSKNEHGKRIDAELKRYRACGYVFLCLNLMLALMVFFMVYRNRTFEHGQIVTIAMAAYTFTAFTFAIVNTVRYRKYHSPVFSASKAISLASASVSMLTLTSTMLTTFGDGELLSFRRAMLGSLGGAVSVFIISMAIYMIVQSTKKIRRLKQEVFNEQ